MEEKKCPVDRGKLLIGLECCRTGRIETCLKCPYSESDCGPETTVDSLAYIYYLEERLGVKDTPEEFVIVHRLTGKEKRLPRRER